MTRLDYALTLEGVTLRIEEVRAEAGQDVDKLAALALAFERELREKAPGTPLLASYAAAVLANYVAMARYGYFPEPHTPWDDL